MPSKNTIINENRQIIKLYGCRPTVCGNIKTDYDVSRQMLGFHFRVYLLNSLVRCTYCINMHSIKRCIRSSFHDLHIIALCLPPTESFGNCLKTRATPICSLCSTNSLHNRACFAVSFPSGTCSF